MGHTLDSYTVTIPHLPRYTNTHIRLKQACRNVCSLWRFTISINGVCPVIQLRTNFCLCFLSMNVTIKEQSLVSSTSFVYQNGEQSTVAKSAFQTLWKSYRYNLTWDTMCISRVNCYYIVSVCWLKNSIPYIIDIAHDIVHIPYIIDIALSIP